MVGYWLKHQNRFALRELVTLSLLCLLLYFCHLFSLVTAFVAIALLTIWQTLLDLAKRRRQQQFDWRSIARSFYQRTLVPCCAFLPTLILTAIFLTRKSTVNTDTIRFPVPIWKQLFHLLSLYSLVSYEKLELVFSTALAGLFVVVSVYLLASKVVRRQMNEWDGFVVVAIAYSFIYFIAPDRMSGGGNIKQRMLLYPFFALIFWFGAQSYPWLVKRRIQLVAAGIALMLLGVHGIKYAQLNRYLGVYASAMHLVEPNKTLLPLSFSPYYQVPDGKVVSQRISPFYHASSYIAVQRHALALTNYQAALDYFPIQFRSQLNPYLYIGLENQPNRNEWGIESVPPRVDFLNYPQRTGRNVDYVLVWRIPEQERDRAYVKAIFSQLEQGYNLIYTSPQPRFMQLYRRKDFR